MSTKTVIFQTQSINKIPEELFKYNAKIEGNNLKISYDKNKTSLKSIINILNKDNITFDEINTYESDLEDVFLKLVKN